MWAYSFKFCYFGKDYNRTARYYRWPLNLHKFHLCFLPGEFLAFMLAFEHNVSLPAWYSPSKPIFYINFSNNCTVVHPFSTQLCINLLLKKVEIFKGQSLSPFFTNSQFKIYFIFCDTGSVLYLSSETTDVLLNSVIMQPFCFILITEKTFFSFDLNFCKYHFRPLFLIFLEVLFCFYKNFLKFRQIPEFFNGLHPFSLPASLLLSFSLSPHNLLIL